MCLASSFPLGDIERYSLLWVRLYSAVLWFSIWSCTTWPLLVLSRSKELTSTCSSFPSTKLASTTLISKCKRGETKDRRTERKNDEWWWSPQRIYLFISLSVSVIQPIPTDIQCFQGQWGFCFVCLSSTVFLLHHLTPHADNSGSNAPTSICNL